VVRRWISSSRRDKMSPLESAGLYTIVCFMGTGGDLGGGQRGTVPRKLEVEGTEVLISPPTFLKYHYKFTHFLHSEKLNPLMGTGNYSATSNNRKLVHWQLMGGLLHLVQRRGDWEGPQPAQAHPRCTKCDSPPINGQCTNHRIAL